MRAQASWWGASSISMRKVSMGVSPMSLKKNRCSRHLRPMDLRAGRRSSSLANLRAGETRSQGWGHAGPERALAPPPRCGRALSAVSPARLLGVLLLAVGLQGRVDLLSQDLDLAGAGEALGIWGGRKRGGRGRRANQTRTDEETWPTRCSFWAPPTHPSPNAWPGKRGAKGLGDGIGKGMFFNECGFLLVSWEISRLRGAAG